ncbi:alpha/beta fold hydrolase [Arenicella sp. 4NH20-0111]|uniref:esterase/lipase family protein n=1 Tax=Arenicella sp. 4NH20-0111 TaxID=3127648 RepID=UPI00310405D4
MSKECVILLHGLARTIGSMNRMQSALNNEGFHTVNQSYPSRKNSIDKLAKTAIDDALRKCPKESEISFVTHSMGGILVRQFLSQHSIENLKNVVMLGPPNKGSEVVDKISNVPGFEFFNGPAGLQLGTTNDSVPNSLGPVDFNLGVIAGNRSFNPILSMMLPNPNDGKVSVENTKVEGMKDHVILPVSHTFMMKNRLVIHQVISFLVRGRFNNPKS